MAASTALTGLQTTVIGSFPKPDYLSVPDWFQTGNVEEACKAYSDLLAGQSQEQQAKLEADFTRATKEVVDVQAHCGIDVVTDGEVRRENYIHYLCRFIENVDFVNLTKTSIRNGALTCELPTIRGPVSWRGPLDVVAEWKKAQELSPRPVKYTLPGPMTIMGTLHDDYYHNEKQLAAALADIINFHARALALAGCKYIQVDEPLFARKPEAALEWGIGMLDRCFADVEGAEKAVHICCGYPQYLDQEGYLKADPQVYFKIAEALDNSSADAVSLEDAHRHNDLTLLKKFRKTKVILGVVKIASSQVESEDDIHNRLTEALQHIDAERLVAAPDCGLAYLPVDLLKRKLTNMCAAARRCDCKRQRTC